MATRPRSPRPGMVRGRGEHARHVRAVVRLATELAARNGEDPACAEAAGWLHDWLRPLSKERLAAIMRARGVRLDAATRAIPAIWHGIAAAAEAPRRLGVRTREVLDAVRWHSTGRPGLGRLGRILFVADFCARDRVFPEAGRGRRIALRSLKLGIRYVLASKLAWLRSQGLAPHPAMAGFWADAAGGPRA